MIESCREDFPALRSETVYLDSAATTLKPQPVIDAVRWSLETGTSAVHRGVHARSVEATNRFESAREVIARWFGADTDEVILTSGATCAINIVRRGLRSLDHVAVTLMEHHSNFVPWLDVSRCDRLPVDRLGQIDIDALERSMIEGAGLVAVVHQSNVLGAISDVRRIAETVKRHGGMVLVDAAQSASHDPPQLHEWGLDFIACSGHKMLGPSGVGALIVNREHYANLDPLLRGGHMVDQVHADRWTLQPPPNCFEAGTPPIESVIGWGAAIEYLDRIGRESVAQRLNELTCRLVDRLTGIAGVHLIGPPSDKRGPLAAFHVTGMESAAVAKILSQRDQVCVRSGYHCAQPLHEFLAIAPTVRASLQIYNNEDDIDRFGSVLESVAKVACM